MSTYYPDRWVIIKIEGTSVPKTYYRIMGSWYGGFAGSDSWKMSSGIEAVEYDETRNSFIMPQTSGSTYICHKQAYGMSSYAASVLIEYQKQNSDKCSILTMDENFDIAAALKE